MRTIKYRGKNSLDEWVYGSLISEEVENDNGKFMVTFIAPSIPCTSNGMDMWTAKMQRVKPETIGQFTGLFDKNNREIYEGDIVKYTRYKVHSEYFKKDFIENDYVVYWNEEKHAFYCTTKFESGGGASGYLNFHDERAEKEEIEVIGNIHDNPELLEGGKNE